MLGIVIGGAFETCWNVLSIRVFEEVMLGVLLVRAYDGDSGKL